MILRGGQNIYPSEIEDALSTHPKVNGVQVVPMPDTRLGEKTCVFIIPKKGEEFAFEEMVAYLSEKNMAKYKHPERMEIVESFNMVGEKVNKRALSLRICRQLLVEGQISEETAEDFERKHKLSG